MACAGRNKGGGIAGAAEVCSVGPGGGGGGGISLASSKLSLLLTPEFDESFLTSLPSSSALCCLSFNTF